MTEDRRHDFRRETDKNTYSCETQIHEDHHEFLKLLIEREKELKSLRKAIIEKTIVGLVWAFLVFLATASWTYVKGFLK